MSPEAERLRNVVGHAVILNGGFDPNYKPHAHQVKRIMSAAVAELGITEEMVAIAQYGAEYFEDLYDGNDRVYYQRYTAMHKAATALATLREVANG